MFWRSTSLETNTQELLVYHVRGTIIGRGTDVLWGNPHPLGWDIIDKACDRAHDLFDDMGWLSSNLTRTGPILQIKEKWGRFVIYAEPSPEQMDQYLDVLVQLIQEFPGIQDYMEIEYAPALTVAKGWEVQRVSRNKDIPDAVFLRLALKFPENESSLKTIKDKQTEEGHHDE